MIVQPEKGSDCVREVGEVRLWEDVSEGTIWRQLSNVIRGSHVSARRKVI